MFPRSVPVPDEVTGRHTVGKPGGLVDRGLRLVHFDISPDHRPPAAVAMLLATVVSLAGSLLVDFLIARLAVVVFPSTKGYPHFLFSDYAVLTVLGVFGACIAWPIVVRLCAEPRWLFTRLAVLVTLVLLLPDLGIYLQGQPAKAVLFLACMHLAIGIITYNALVRLSPAGAVADPRP